MADALDPQWHQDQIELFAGQQPSYTLYASLLQEILQRARKNIAPLAIIESRAKTVMSFAEKAVRRWPKLKDPVNQLTDLAGARVITQTQDEVERFSRFIRDHFVIDEANSEDKRIGLGTSEFGYLSVHYIVQFKSDADTHGILGVAIPAALVKAGLKAEIQVRTMLQHAWASISHDSLYKNQFRPPAEWMREMNRLAARLEEADRNFAEFVARLDHYATCHGAYMSDEQRRRELDTLTTLARIEPDPQRQMQTALRMAAIHRAVAEWGAVVADLAPHLTPDPNPRLAREYGNALCHLHRDAPRGKDYKAGLGYLERAVTADDMDHEAHAQLAWALENSGDDSRRMQAGPHYERAYRLRPDNPYYLSLLLESCLGGRQAFLDVAALGSALRQGIQVCRDHAKAGIELPWAYMTMGRFHLLLGETYQALDAYLRALRLCLRADCAGLGEAIEEELAFLYKLEPLKSLFAEAYQCSVKLLSLGAYAKTHLPAPKPKSAAKPDETARECPSPPAGMDGAVTGQSEAKAEAGQRLKKMALDSCAHQDPVLIVAGSCADSTAKEMQDYADLLEEALAPFEGEVLCGGTTSGISGVVGGLSAPGLRKLGYLPERLPRNATRDPRYQICEVPGEGFSPDQPLQAWVDLLLAGIKPQAVRLLGFGGGQVAEFEYKLALTLGAGVGLLLDSRRQAEAMLADPDWHEPGNPVPLPRDAMTLWAFVTRVPNLLGERQLEEAACQVHERYRVQRMKDPKEEALKPWDKVNPDFKDSNRQQIQYSLEILRQAGFVVVDVPANTEPEIPSFSIEEVDKMAAMEHGRYVVERLRKGWERGDDRDALLRKSPYLIPWNGLSEDTKDYDRRAVRDYPENLKILGKEIRRR